VPGVSVTIITRDEAAHIGAAIFNHATGIQAVHVPFKVLGDVFAETLAGNVHYFIFTVPSTLPMIKDGRLRALAVTTAKRSVALPDVPTFAEAGFPAARSDGWFGIVAPAGAPRRIVAQVSRDVAQMLRDPKLVQRFALQGAEVTAADISSEMLRVAQTLARHYTIEIQTAKIFAEAMPFQDGAFDCVYGNGVLHHVELEPALREISRVLAVGGRAVFIEPLAHNPAIQVYRWLAREVRTPTERPFVFKSFRMVRRYFPTMVHREFWLLSLGIFLYYYFIERVDPRVDRYWKRILRDGWRVERAFRLLHRTDEVILRALPWVRRWCWNTVIVLEKR